MTERSTDTAAVDAADDRAELRRLRTVEAERGKALTREERAELGRLRAKEAIHTPYTPTELPQATPLQRLLLPNAGGVVVLLAVPVFLIAGWSMAAWLIVLGIWLVNRLAHAAIMHLVVGMSQTMAIGMAGFGMMLRVWTMAFVLFFVGADAKVGHTQIGLGRRDLAVPALLTFLVVLTADLMVRGAFELRRYKGIDMPAVRTADPETPA